MTKYNRLHNPKDKVAADLNDWPELESGYYSKTKWSPDGMLRSIRRRFAAGAPAAEVVDRILARKAAMERHFFDVPHPPEPEPKSGTYFDIPADD